MPGPASSVEERSFCNILRFKGLWLRTCRTLGFFWAVAKIYVHQRILEKCPGVTQPRLLETKKAVATVSLSEREHSPIKLVIWRMLTSYILICNSRNIRCSQPPDNFGYRTPDRKRVDCKCPGPRDKKRPTSQRGKDERRISWKKIENFEIC